MYLLRDVQRADLPSLKRLAAVLNTVNLPNDEETLVQLIDISVRSFAGKVRDPFEREYLFVLENAKSEEVVGTSLVIAQHGTKEAPHTYYEVSEREHYSVSLDRHFRHKVLSIAYNYAGPTEIGGLVVDPPHRSGPEKPGKQLSYVRFLFLAMHRALFRERVLAELMPPLMPDGRSLLWEAVGKKFTGLTYVEADRLSHQNKEFIKELFPSSDIYVSLFPDRTQKVVGEVGSQTRGVQRMLERIGFRYVERVDPFDGGPHFEASTQEILLVRQFRTARVSAEPLETEDAEDMLVGVDRDGARNRFRAVRTQARLDDQVIFLPPATRELLGVTTAARVGAIPFEVA
jgi:arginine N-succinyltransferase